MSFDPRRALVAEMLDLQAGHRSGTLEIEAEGVHTIVYFSRGQVVFAEQGTFGDTLGHVLVREGKLTEEQRVAALRRMTERVSDSEQMRFGEVVVELGFLKPEDVHEALGTQVRQKSMRCLLYSSPTSRFHDDPDRLAVGHFPVAVELLIMEAARLFAPKWVARVLELDDLRYTRLTAPAVEIATKLNMSRAERAFLQGVDGTLPTHVLISKQHPGVEQLEAMLAGLVLARFAELTLEPAAPRVEPPPAPPAQQKGVSPSPPTVAAALAAPPPAPKPAATPVVTVPTPVVTVPTPVVTVPTPVVTVPTPMGAIPTRRRVAIPASIPPPPVEAKVAAAAPKPATASSTFRRVALPKTKPPLPAEPPAPSPPAPEVRKPSATMSATAAPAPAPVKDVEAEKAATRKEADAAYARARETMRSETIGGALHDLRRAYALCPDVVEFALCLKWAEFSEHPTEQGRLARREDLKKLAGRSVKADPNLALGYFILGQIAMLEGEDASVSIRFFKHALKLDAKLIEAQRSLRLLTMRAGGPAKGS